MWSAHCQKKIVRKRKLFGRDESFRKERPRKSIIANHKKNMSSAYLGQFKSKHTAAHVRDYHILRNDDNLSMSSIAVQLNFHPRTYLTADGSCYR